MSKPAKNSKIPAETVYVPRAVGVHKYQRPQNSNYTQYITINNDFSQGSNNREKDYIEEDLIKNKNDRKMKKEDEPQNNRPASRKIDRPIEHIPTSRPVGRPTESRPASRLMNRSMEPTECKPLIECYTSRHYMDSPIVEAKKSAPIKKLNFVIPDEHKQKPLDRKYMDWKDYHKLHVIHQFMDDLESDYPSLCTTDIIGKSIEGRNLKVLKISNSDASNAAVWLDSGIHAREWIAPAVNTYIANHISRNFENLPQSVRNKDWYFLPVVNPDGYHYSHSVDRMWRKNRAWYAGQCVGVDLNRNFSVGWGGKGSSPNPRSAFYKGPRPFSEPESSAIRDMFLHSGVNFKVYITLHSYGQIIIFPYAFSNALAPDYIRLLQGATAMSKAIYNTNGNTYKVGVSRDVMYGAAGTSNDFAYGGAGVPYCYLIELRSKQYKFRLPREQIEETGNEILASVKALMEFVDTYPKDVKVDPNINLLVESNQSDLKKTASDIHRASSHLKKHNSYNKNSYSYADKTDTSVQKKDSYVKWINLDPKKEDSQEKSCENKNEVLLKNINATETTTETTTDTNTNKESTCNKTESNTNNLTTCNKTEQEDILKDNSVSFLHKNLALMKEIDLDSSNSLLDQTDSVLKATNTDKNKVHVCLPGTKSPVKKSDSNIMREDSYEVWNDFYDHQTDFYEKRNILLEKTTNTFN